MNRALLVIFWLIAISHCLFGQAYDSTTNTVFPTGLSLQVGLGSYALRDEFISREKYSGTLPAYILRWNDVAERRASRISFEYRGASEIKNFNVSASIVEFSFGLEYLYPLGKFSLLSNDVFAYLGPSPDFFLHFRSQNIASGGSALTRAYSVAMLFSAGSALEFASPIDKNLLVSAALGTNVFSLGVRFVNPNNSDEPFLKLLTLFSGLRLKSDIALCYALSSSFSVKLAYRLEISRIDAWDYFVSGSDMGLLSIEYGF